MSAITLASAILSCEAVSRADGPLTICYSTQPEAYFNDHAAEIKKIYDGFFFSIGSWENTRQRYIGVDGAPAKEPRWRDAVRANLAALRKAGVTENFLTCAFMDNGDWPSPRTLLSADYTRGMAAEFGTIGAMAKDLGFRGVCRC